jgi:hypothetical protein
MYQSETFPRERVNNELQLSILIADLHRTFRLIDAAIQAEEGRARTFDLSSPTYPVLARHLRVRRDNLLATISLLEARRVPAAA